MNKVIKIAKNNWIILLGVIIGIICGLLYSQFITCSNDTCIIRSSPIISLIWGGLIGGWLSGLIKSYK